VGASEIARGERRHQRELSGEHGGADDLGETHRCVTGPLGNPNVVVNPLSALTPGFLRGLFKIFD